MVKSNDKKRARLAAMRSLLARFDYESKDYEAARRPDELIVGAPTTLKEDHDDASPTPIR